MSNRFKLGVTVLLLLTAGNLIGQATASSTLQGTVYDQSQAVIPGAEVVITNKATGEIRTTTTNDSGNYQFNLLSAGTYAIKVSKPGFASFAQNVNLLIGQTTTANAVLQPGTTT